MSNQQINKLKKQVSSLQKSLADSKKDVTAKANKIANLEGTIANNEKELKAVKLEKEAHRKALKEHLDMFLGVTISEDTKQELTKAMVDFPDNYKKILTRLLNTIKMEILVKAAKVTDNVGHIKFMNGSMSALNILELNIKDTLNHTKSSRSVLTRQEVE